MACGKVCGHLPLDVIDRPTIGIGRERDGEADRVPHNCPQEVPATPARAAGRAAGLQQTRGDGLSGGGVCLLGEVHPTGKREGERGQDHVA